MIVHQFNLSNPKSEVTMCLSATLYQVKLVSIYT